MFDGIKKMKEALLSKFQNRIIFLSCISVGIFIVIMMIFSYTGFNNLYSRSSTDVESGIKKINNEFIANYVDKTSELVQVKLQRFEDDQSILGDLFQKYIDNEKDFSKLTSDMSSIPYFKDQLTFNGRWYQNSKVEPSVVLVGRYFTDKNKKIKPEVQKEINRSMILDYLMPSVYKYGGKKLWLYFEGSQKASFMRVTPWNNIGKALDEVYPKFTDVEIWEAFNPGLVSAWEKMIKDRPEYKKDLTKFSIIKPPTEDGGTGKIIMTMDFPVWNKQRTSFAGAINVDVELNEIINMVNNVKLAKTGFAYITLSNGNILALNKTGEQILGLKSAMASTKNTSSGSSYNNMLRYFKDSSYKEVRNISQPSDNSLWKNEINIDNKKYIVYQKNLKPLQTWTKEKGIYNETWSIGFVVPESELMSPYEAIRSEISGTKNRIIKEEVIAFLLIVAGLILFMVIAVNRNLKPLSIITGYAGEVAGGDFNKNLPSNFLTMKDEIGDLSRAIQTISEAYRKENDELEHNIQQKNEELEEQYKYIVETERIASLGNLVAGVAHEINTPLGNGITTLTYLQMINQENRRKLSEGTMSKGDLQKFFGELNDSINVMNINLTRAAELVKSFKKIAVDQTNEIRVNFNVRDNIEAVLLSLKHEYKNTKHKIIVECDENINLNSYPGAFSQILTNFIMNSLVHGYKNLQEGNIYITASKDSERFTLIYSDEGIGIPNENLSKVFEPFFTTDPKAGSSGLGLHIVHNLVIKQLMGTIRCENNSMTGVKFTIEIPIIIEL